MQAIMKRIYLYGGRGMLGQMVRRYFSGRAGWEVVPIEIRFDPTNLINHFERYNREPQALFINGIGAIPQKASSVEDFVVANILVPLELARGLAPQHMLVHPSTDCIFSGDLGRPYPRDARPDASDHYGWSKLHAESILGARPRTLIMRTSIVGPSECSTTGLLQWFLSQPANASIQGYTNHFWNGLTTLQWCVELEKLLSLKRDEAELVQIGTVDGYSKHQMLCMFRDVFRPDINVQPVEHGSPVDRRLLPEVTAPSLAEQLNLLAEFMRRE